MLSWVRRLCLGLKACNVPLPTLGVVMIHIFVIALLCVLILYVVYTYLPMDGALKKPIFAVLSILFLIWFIYALYGQGVFAGTLGSLR